MPAEIAALFRQARPLHRRARRRAITPSMLTGGADRTSISRRASRSARASIPRRWSGWRTPSRFISGTSRKADGRLRLFAFAGADDPAAASLRHPRAVRFPRRESGVAGPDDTRPRRRYRLRDRCARGVPASAHPNSPSQRCRPLLLPRKGTLRACRLREDVLRGPQERPGHLRPCAASTGKGLHGRGAAGPVCRACAAARCACGARNLFRRLIGCRRMHRPSERAATWATPVRPSCARRIGSERSNEAAGGPVPHIAALMRATELLTPKPTFFPIPTGWGQAPFH